MEVTPKIHFGVRMANSQGGRVRGVRPWLKPSSSSKGQTFLSPSPESNPETWDHPVVPPLALSPHRALSHVSSHRVAKALAPPVCSHSALNSDLTQR